MICVVRTQNISQQSIKNAESRWVEWGPVDRSAATIAQTQQQRYWVIEVTVQKTGRTRIVGEMSSQPTRYGPNVGSRAENISISLVTLWRRQGLTENNIWNRIK